MPIWVDQCVEDYKLKGFSEEEAWKRCQGAYEKQKEQKKKKKGKKDKNSTRKKRKQNKKKK